MKALLREIYNDITDVLVCTIILLLGGFGFGTFLGATTAVGFIVFNILMEVLL